MLYFNIKDYQEFKELFGSRTCGNGNTSRRNKIILAMWKSKDFRHQLENSTDESIVLLRNRGWVRQLFHCKEMASLTGILRCMVRRARRVTLSSHEFDIYLNDDEPEWSFSSESLEIDGRGLCEDMDAKCIRYKNLDTDRVYKMKSGKFLRTLLEENPFGRILPEQVKVFLCEEFTEKWVAYASAELKPAQLHLGTEVEDFERIYNSQYYKAGFGSCMASSSPCHASFYYDAVDAKAAWLEDSNGRMLARCIVFTKVYDETDEKTIRVAERQYAADGDNGLKRQLVDALIAAGEIDAYKQVGVDCHNNRAYVLNDGSSISDHKLSISCHLHDDDVLSYQDSFVYYDEDAEIAYNYCNGDADECLNSTDDYFHSNRNRVYSEWHDEWIDNDEAMYVDSRNDYFYRDEVVWCVNTQSDEYEEDAVELNNGDYAYYGRNCEGYDGVYHCPECDEWYLEDDGEYSELMDEYYCCEDCLVKAENRHIALYHDAPEGYVKTADTGVWMSEERAFYSELLDQYFEGSWERFQAEEKRKKEEKEMNEQNRVLDPVTGLRLEVSELVPVND